VTTSAVGWTCPRCERGVSPWVQVCPCRDEGSAGALAPLAPSPQVTPGGAPESTTLPDGGICTATLPWTQTMTSTTWQGVTILNAGRAA
jgi:hypothetical protein